MSPVKRSVRKLLDRAVAPYLDQVQTAVGAPLPAIAAQTSVERASNVPSDFFHGVLHELRTLELERVPKGAKHVLSVGANGRWYFDWFEHSYDPVLRHIGVEAYEPKPDDLPSYVEWIVNTADKMTGVEDASVELVFAGQTTEHLWADELAGFLLESHRVLTDGGLLVLDSPNRLVTEHLSWSHGGHTVELSSAEITELLALAGFEVETLNGLWMCVHEGRVLQLEEELGNAALTTRRIAQGRTRPDQCFVWWIVARRLTSGVDPTRLRQRAEELYEEHWPLRVNRGIMASAADIALRLPRGTHGVVTTSLPFVMSPGGWQLTATLTDGEWSELSELSFDVVEADGTTLHHLDLRSAALRHNTANWDIEQQAVSFALSLRISVDEVRQDAVLALPIDLRRAG